MVDRERKQGAKIAGRTVRPGDGDGSRQDVGLKFEVVVGLVVIVEHVAPVGGATGIVRDVTGLQSLAAEAIPHPGRVGMSNRNSRLSSAVGRILGIACRPRSGRV